jgi:hypothetical protein
MFFNKGSWNMKSSRIFLICLIGIVLATAASAAWVPLPGEPVPLSSLLQGGSLTFGDKEVSEFELLGFSNGGALDPNPDMMFIQGGWDDATGDYGLKFNVSWSAYSGQGINVNLSFKVSILPGYDDYFIKDVAMYLTGVSATGTGGVSVGETVWDAPFPEGHVIASLSCSKQDGDNGAYLTDYAQFAPLKEIWIRSKDISITGGTGPGGSAHLSEFFQFYSQVPEPATVALLGLGSLTILTRKRKRLLDSGRFGN